MPITGFSRPGDGAGGLKIADKLNFVANLNSKGQSASMSDSTSVLVSKVSNLGNVGSKQYVSNSGVTTSGLNTVTGLPFTPKYVTVKYTDGSGNYYQHTLSSPVQGNSSYTLNDTALMISTNNSNMPAGYNATGSVIITNGFKFASQVPAGYSFTYDAYGS